MDSSNNRRKPMSGKERIQKMRDKQKAENRQEYLEKERKRIAELRKKKRENMTESKRKEQTRYERERKRAQRAKAKMNKRAATSPASSTTTSPQTPYRCKQTFAKAIIRTFKALPKSPNKQKAVINGLAQRVGIELLAKMDENLCQGPTETELLVKQFFYRPDIVYTCPGMKDFITVWKGKEKEKMQKHYLTMFLHEAFAVFKEENPHIKLGLSKFCSLRPKNVILLKDTPAEQCKCMIHENFMLKLKGLKYTYSNDFWKSIVCDDKQNSICWQNKCVTCKDGKLMLVPAEPNSRVTWKEWIKTDDLKIKLVEKETKTGILFHELINDLPNMMHHVNTKRIQQMEFEKDKNSATKRILQIDFAMSFSAEYQNEIQSALWSRTSVLLFTAAVFFEGSCKTYMICSDTKKKDKDTILTFLDLLFTEVLKADARITEEVIWSDGPSSEFKNRYMVKALEIIAEKHNRNVTWKYFATSHGKGVVDGVGGNIKRLVRAKMMSQGNNCVIQSAKDFAEAAALLNTKTQIFFVQENHITEEVELKKPWENVAAVPGIKSFHQIAYRNKQLYSKLNGLTEEICISTPDQNDALSSGNYKEGDWVVVRYDGTHFPGEIVKIWNWNEYDVNVMVQTSVPHHYKWPSSMDCLAYRLEDIMKKISPPVVANSRGMFKFNDAI